MPLGMEVNLGPGDVVLDGVAASPKRGTALSFRPCLLWPNGLMDEDATWYEVDLGPGHIVLDGDLAPPLRKGHSSPPLFVPCLLWPRSPIPATAELLSIFKNNF